MLASQTDSIQHRAQAMRFFLLDKITRWEVGVAAEGLKSIA